MFFFCFSLILWELLWKWFIVVQKCDNCKQFYNIAIVKDTHALQLFSHQIKLCFSCLTLFQEDILFYLIKVHCLRLGKSQFTFPIKLRVKFTSFTCTEYITTSASYTCITFESEKNWKIIREVVTEALGIVLQEWSLNFFSSLPLAV